MNCPICENPMLEVGVETLCRTIGCPVIDDWTDWTGEKMQRVGKEIMASNLAYINSEIHRVLQNNRKAEI